MTAETGGGTRDRRGKDIGEFWGMKKLFYILTVGSYNDIGLARHQSFISVDFTLCISKKKKNQSLKFVVGQRVSVVSLGVRPQRRSTISLRAFLV